MRHGLHLAAVLAMLALLSPGVARADGQLVGTVGPGFSIGLTGSDGKAVTQLAPGTYTILVHDQADIHNFHLSGPGVNQATDVEGTGDTTWTVTLQDGTYTFVCDAHPTTMKGSFTVGTGAQPPPPPPPPVQL